nr:phage minor capsid protein [uncultured Ruminococcus sp.]
MPTEYDLSRAFERIESYLIDSMMRNFKRHRAEETEHGYNWEQWQTKQLEALETYRRNNREKFSTEFAELNDKVGEMLRNTASDAAYKQERRILEAIRKGYKPDRGAAQTQAAFFKLNERKMNALVEATTHDLEKAEFAVLRRSNDAYRKAIFDAQVFMNSGSGTYEQAVDMAVKDMLSAGLQCVEYSNGARHTLPDYSEIAIRTANKRAYLRGQGDILNKYGVTTVIINRRHGACGKCADYVGMVFIDDVYAGGKPTDAGGKYPLLSDAMKSGLFHPRCKDSASPYFEGISTPPDREVLPKKAQEDLTEIERAEQKEQYGRRMEKMYRRLEKYALDPGNKKLYAGRKSQWSEYTEKWHDYHEKLLAKAVKSGIIQSALVKTMVNDVHYIGKIDKEIYKCVTEDIVTEEVIITDERIAHIKENHPNDYEMYCRFLTESVEKPDYIIEANKPHSALILKSFEQNNLQFKMILRLVTPKDNPNFKNSIITFMKINDFEWRRLINNKKILYKAE